MLPFAIKVLCFVVAFLGMLSCWAILVPFGRVVNHFWGPIAYCVGVTLLEGIFCLGMIWKMDPFVMPYTFCLAQTIVVGFSTFLLAGVLCAFSIATYTCVTRINKRVPTDRVFIWKHYYLIPLVVFPFGCSAAQVIVLVKYQAIKPTDNLICDAVDPLWVRFLGYAGSPWIVTIPSLFLSTTSVVRILKTRNRLEYVRRSRIIRQDTSLRLRRSPSPTALGFVSLSPPPSANPYHRAPVSPTTDHVKRPLQAPSPAMLVTASQGTAEPELDDARSLLSLVFFSPLSPKVAMNYADLNFHRENENRGRFVSFQSSESELISPIDRADSILQRGSVDEGDRFHTVNSSPRDVSYSVFSSHNRIARRDSANPPLPDLLPAVWRIIFFQFLFTTVILLASLSTILDVVIGRSSPTPFGSQHVALMLTGWGPAMVFGHSPAVRRRLMFWKHI